MSQANALTAAKIEKLLSADLRAMKQLQLVRDYGPEGAFVAAGFVRNRVWDALYEQENTIGEADVDIVYFCENNPAKAQDMACEGMLQSLDASTEWQVRNQARMHDYGGHQPFTSLEHALTHWAETATAVGVRLGMDDNFHFIAPFGFEDLANHVLRITPVMRRHDPEGFEARLSQKRWLQRWPKMQVIR